MSSAVLEEAGFAVASNACWYRACKSASVEDVTSP